MPVNEKVTDISEALLTMTEEMRLMRETIDSQHADICQLNRNIDRLNADLRKRDKQIDELKAKLARYEAPDKNSGNSSTPPPQRKASKTRPSAVPGRSVSRRAGSLAARRDMRAAP